MNGITTELNPNSEFPPPDVLSGLALMVHGLNPDTTQIETWKEPWRSVGHEVARANGQRRIVLQECIKKQCGDGAADVTRSIFNFDMSKPDKPEADWEPPIPLRSSVLPPFPTTVLPDWLQQFVEAEAEATQTPPDMAAMMALSILSLALTRKMIVHVRPGWIEPVNVWTVTTMEPANRKSAVVRDLLEPVVQYQQEETMRMAPSIRQMEAERKIVEARCERLRQRAAKASGEDAERLTADVIEATEQLAAMVVPTAPKWWTDDCTPEMMGSLLARHGGRMAIISAEGNVFELMAGRYSQGRPNIGVYLAGHAGDTYMVDRRGRPPEYIPYSAISVGITVQLEVLRSLAEKPAFRGCGLLARFLYSIPPSWLGSRKIEPLPVPGEIRARYARHILQLLALPFRQDENNADAAHVVPLDESASALIRDQQRRLEPQLGPYGELSTIRDWAGKLCGATARIAGLLHAASRSPSPPWDRPISAITMHAAVRIAEYLTAHARAAFGEMGADPLIDQARFILGWIERKQLQTFTQRELFEGVRGDSRFKRVDTLQPVLELLLEHNWLRRKVSTRTGRGRRHSGLFDVSPYLCHA